MPKNEREQFARNDISINLPSFSGLYKILIIGILLFPWYTILKNKDYSTTIFFSILGTEYCRPCSCSFGPPPDSNTPNPTSTPPNLKLN